MEVGELVTKADVKEIEDTCQFKIEKQAGPAKAAESPPDDDEDGVESIQENDGGVLGSNVEDGKAGVADGGPYSTTEEIKAFLFVHKANDSQRGRMTRLRLKSYRDLAAGDFPFTVAAHHLIPGNASLYKADAKLINFMEDGGKVKTPVKKRNVTIEGHIGYDVNGAHNGVWLPGNYAIKRAKPQRKVKGKIVAARVGTTPKAGWSWGELGDGYAEWQFAYVAGACKAAHGQFHDSHASPYSESVTKNLLKMAAALTTHLDSECTHCKGDKVPPPFKIKQRLFALSATLRTFALGPPGGWKDPWFTSERWSGIFFKGGKVTDEFMKAYNEAQETQPGEPRPDDNDAGA